MRETGHYWVRFENENWIIGFYDSISEEWYFVGYKQGYSDEQQITRRK